MRRWRSVLQRGKLNNKAMTLIEVLVAMAILTVVVTPTLRMFASAFGTNLRSKWNQRAITVGESVMETFKAYPVEQLCVQFKNGSYKFAEGTIAGTTSVEADFTDGTSGSPLRGNNTLKTVQQIKELKFKMTGVKVDTSTYNIDINVKPHLDTTTNRTPAVVKFENPNEYTDAIIQLEESRIVAAGDLDILNVVVNSFKEQAKTAFLSTHASYSYTFSNIELTGFKRVIEIDVTDNGSSQKVTEKVTYSCTGARLKYTYIGGNGSGTIISGSNTDPDGDPVTLDPDVAKYEVQFRKADGTVESPYVVYNNADTISGGNRDGRVAKLENVYLYYFPVYQGVYGKDANDEIVINTHDLSGLYNGEGGTIGSDGSIAAGKEPLNVYIIRQLSTQLDDATLRIDEPRYNFKVTGSRQGSVTGKVRLWHNFGVELKETISAAPVNTNIPAAGVNGSDLFMSVGTLEGAVEENTGLIYDITVDVYNAETSKLVSQYSGTINE